MRALMCGAVLVFAVCVAGCGKATPTTATGEVAKGGGLEPKVVPDEVAKLPTSVVARGEPVAKLSAIDLFNEYGANTLAADKKYKGKLIEVTGWGVIARDGERYTFGFEVIVFPGMTQAQLARLSAREQKWFRDGKYPPNVIAKLNSEGEKGAADYKSGQTVRVTGFVRGTKKADVWRDHIVEMDDCDLKLVEASLPVKK